MATKVRTTATMAGVLGTATARPITAGTSGDREFILTEGRLSYRMASGTAKAYSVGSDLAPVGVELHWCERFDWDYREFAHARKRQRETEVRSVGGNGQEIHGAKSNDIGQLVSIDDDRQHRREGLLANEEVHVLRGARMPIYADSQAADECMRHAESGQPARYLFGRGQNVGCDDPI